MRGKNKSLKRYLRKQRKNVIDPKAVSVVLLGCCAGDSQVSCIGCRQGEVGEAEGGEEEGTCVRTRNGGGAEAFCFGPLQTTKLVISCLICAHLPYTSSPVPILCVLELSPNGIIKVK